MSSLISIVKSVQNPNFFRCAYSVKQGGMLDPPPHRGEVLDPPPHRGGMLDLSANKISKYEVSQGDVRPPV